MLKHVEKNRVLFTLSCRFPCFFSLFELNFLALKLTFSVETEENEKMESKEEALISKKSSGLLKKR